MKIFVQSGTAAVHVGPLVKATHRELAQLTPEAKPFRVGGLAPGTVASVQSETPFTYELFPPPAPVDPGGPRAADGGVHAVLAFWACDVPTCTGADWTGQVIPWPAWSSHHSNARKGMKSRSVFSQDGDPLYPYMGPWADGCKVTTRTGEALIVEWHRGTDEWREKLLPAGQSYVISLKAPEDTALIESNDISPGFSVAFENCTPKPLPGKRVP
jgi:hypothetical protein